VVFGLPPKEVVFGWPPVEVCLLLEPKATEPVAGGTQ